MYCYTYKLPLTSTPSFLPFSVRTGLILETAEGWGEAAPLPGYSDNPLDSLVFALRSVKQPFPTRSPAIRINALASTPQEAERALKSGFQTLKYKVKGLSPQQAAVVVLELQSFRTPLRIDVNRSWSVEEAKRFLESVDVRFIDYIEEPLQEPERLLELPPFPFALDETLREKRAEKLAMLECVRALVLKPTLLGNSLNRWIEFGKQHGKILTFSSSYESAIGLVHIACLQELHSPTSAAGLDTFRAFQQNFLPFPLEQGQLVSQEIPPINRSWLCKIVP